MGQQDVSKIWTDYQHAYAETSSTVWQVNFDLGTVPGPTAATTPEQSPPGSPGSPGYMPRMLSTSLKFSPTARTDTCSAKKSS